MQSTMMDVPLSLNHLLERAGQLFAGNEIVSRLPDKSLRRHSFGDYHRRTRALASALQQLGLAKGDRVAQYRYAFVILLNAIRASESRKRDG